MVIVRVMIAGGAPAGRTNDESLTTLHSPVPVVAGFAHVEAAAFGANCYLVRPFHHPSPRFAAVRAAAALRRAGQDAGLDQLARERGEVRAGEGFGGDGPDGASVAASGRIGTLGRHLPTHTSRATIIVNATIAPLASPVLSGFPHRLRVVVVPLALAQEEQGLVALGRPVGHALGHGVGLVPDDVRAEIPAVGLERQRHAPRDTDEVFGLEAVRLWSTLRRFDRGVSRLLRVGLERSERLSPAAGVRIPEIHPSGA